MIESIRIKRFAMEERLIKVGLASLIVILEQVPGIMIRFDGADHGAAIRIDRIPGQ